MGEPLKQSKSQVKLPSLKEYPSLLRSWLRYPKEEQLEIARLWAKMDLYFLLRYPLRRTDIEREWLFARCREIQESPDGHLDLWARFHYKSTIITFGLTVQDILCNPETTVGIFSHTRPIAKSFLRQVKRELEGNEYLKACFPDILYQEPAKQSPKWSEDDGLIVKRQGNPKECTLEAWGLVDGMPVGKHFDVLLYDDIVTRESVTTPEMIAKTTDALRLSYALGSENARRRMIGTRYNMADSYDAVLKDGTFKPRIYPATHDGTVDGKPVLLTQPKLDSLKVDMQDYIFACQMLQNPIAGSEHMFDVNDLQSYEVRPHTLNAYLLIDPARSRKKDSANTAMVVLGMDYAGNKYLLDGVNHRMDLQERWEWMKNLYVKWLREPGIQTVKVGYERFGALADLDYFREKMTVERLSIPIEELEWPREGDGSKIDRVQRLGPDIRSRRFYLPYPTTDKSLTADQEKMKAQGAGYRVSSRIRRKDSEGNLYDVSEQLKMQIHYFPFGGLKDLVDAASRIYDMEAVPPVYIEQTSLEPEFA
jgi:hypothetical protein